MNSKEALKHHVYSHSSDAATSMKLQSIVGSAIELSQSRLLEDDDVVGKAIIFPVPPHFVCPVNF